MTSLSLRFTQNEFEEVLCLRPLWLPVNPKWSAFCDGCHRLFLLLVFFQLTCRMMPISVLNVVRYIISGRPSPSFMTYWQWSTMVMNRPRTVWFQFLSKNCVDSSVPIKELCRQFSSYQRTVSTVQFLSKNCVNSSVPIKELCRQFSSYQRTVSTVQFRSWKLSTQFFDRNWTVRAVFKNELVTWQSS